MGSSALTASRCGLEAFDLFGCLRLGEVGGHLLPGFAGEGLEAGTIDVGLIPGGTYVLYDDGAEVILTATRNGLSKDSDNAKDWNDGQPTEASEKQAVSYRALIIAGPSDKGQEPAAKVNGGELTTKQWWPVPRRGSSTVQFSTLGAAGQAGR